jgi:hypothetical protein
MQPHPEQPLPPDIPDVEPAQPPMSEVARLTGVFSSPSAAFRDIAARPRWWIPLILLGLFGTLFSIAFDQKVGFENFVRQTVERSPQAQNMTRPQIEQAANFGGRIARFASYGSIAVLLCSTFIISAIFKFVFDVLMGAEIGLNRMMGIVSYSYLPNLIATALAFLVLNLKPAEDFDLQNPLAFNAGSFMSLELPAWVRSLGTSIDLFSFWIMILMAIGISVAGRKISFGKAFAGVLIPWALFILLRAGAAGLRGA